MRRALVACTAISLLGVVSALLDHGLSHGVLWSSERTGLRREVLRLASGALAGAEKVAFAAAERAATPLAPAEHDEAAPHILAASMTPLSRTLPEEPHQPEQDVNRQIKADRLALALTEVSVPKLVVPEPEPITEGVSAALFLLSPGLPPAPAPAHAAAAAPPAPAAPVVTAAVGPLSAKPRAPFGVQPPAKNPFVTSATTSAAPAAPPKYGWSDLVRMASMKAGDGEEPAKIFGALSEKEFRARELRCMATAIYFEARGESVRGQIAVGQVVMNRLRSDFYPKTICGVVFQGQWNRNACQFSFACDGKTDVIRENDQWTTALDVAKQVISGKAYLNDIADATHYHAVYVRPDWRRQVRRLKQIGVHIFYKAPHINPLVEDPAYQGLDG
jgi:spore germination cell wall hydrolase CwlJ-like protein